MGLGLEERITLILGVKKEFKRLAFSAGSDT